MAVVSAQRICSHLKFRTLRRLGILIKVNYIKLSISLMYYILGEVSQKPFPRHSGFWGTWQAGVGTPTQTQWNKYTLYLFSRCIYIYVFTVSSIQLHSSCNASQWMEWSEAPLGPRLATKTAHALLPGRIWVWSETWGVVPDLQSFYIMGKIGL